MIARALSILACVCFCFAMADGRLREEPPKPDDKKASPTLLVVADAKNQLEKILADTKTHEEAIRARIAMHLLATVPTDVTVLGFDKPVGFDEGLLRYQLTKATQSATLVHLSFTVVNSADAPASVADVAKRLKEGSLWDQKGKEYAADALTTAVNKGLPANGSLDFTRTFRKPAVGDLTAKELFLDFPNDKTRAYVRVIIPTDSVTK